MKKNTTVFVLGLLCLIASSSALAKGSEKAKLGEQENPCGCRVSDQKDVSKPQAASDSKPDAKTGSAQIAR